MTPDPSRPAAAAPDTLYDVLVIGGGPGGIAVAPLLVQKGYKVALLEKAHHPRFHIGESLLPANLLECSGNLLHGLAQDAGKTFRHALSDLLG